MATNVPNNRLRVGYEHAQTLMNQPVILGFVLILLLFLFHSRCVYMLLHNPVTVGSLQ